MSDSTRESIYEAIASIRLIDPHTHINPHAPASSTLADLLGYHYYTELAHSAGMPKSEIEEEGLQPRELVRRLVENLSPIENTAQYSWLVEICRMFFGFEGDRIDTSNWEEVYDSAERQMRSAEWPQMVLDQSNVEAVFLTNDFDDDLAGFDTDTYIPCLRTDDLVFHLPKPATRERLAACSGVELDGSLGRLRDSLDQRFRHFVESGARACAISLPPSFEPAPVSDGRAETALEHVLQKGPEADPAHQAALSRRVFWTLAELCDHYGLPFDLMIGVNRGVYSEGVFQGQDLYDSRVSLIQYRQLFNSFPHVKFPISVLASVTNQELVSYAWIFPNVITNGHWWYSNTPSFISRDAAARLEAVPQTKQIGYYSDAYKLEFVWPKFDMYRRILAGILADDFVKRRGWSEERAIELGRQVLRDNVDEIFPRPVLPETEAILETTEAMEEDPQATWVDPQAGTSAALAAGAIGMVEIDEGDEVESDVDDAPDLEPSEDEHGFSTIVMDSDALTVNEEPANDETVRIAQGSDPAASDEESALPDLPTKIDLDDTIRIEDASDVEFAESEAEVDLDPLPSDDELDAVGVDDVELRELAPESRGPDAETIETEADDEALDIGDIFADDDSTETSESESEIRMLRGENSFQLDEDSLQLRPDPVTGELTFPVADQDNDADGADSEDIHATIDPNETTPLSEPIEMAEIDLDETDFADEEFEAMEEQDGSEDSPRP